MDPMLDVMKTEVRERSMASGPDNRKNGIANCKEEKLWRRSGRTGVQDLVLTRYV